MQVRADLNIKNDSLHLIRLTTSSYLSSFLRAILEAKWRWKVEVSVLSPPVTEMTNGVRFHVQHSLPPVIIPFLFLLVFGKNFFNKHIFLWVRIKIRDSHIKTYILSVSVTPIVISFNNLCGLRSLFAHSSKMPGCLSKEWFSFPTTTPTPWTSALTALTVLSMQLRFFWSVWTSFCRPVFIAAVSSAKYEGAMSANTRMVLRKGQDRTGQDSVSNLKINHNSIKKDQWWNLFISSEGLCNSWKAREPKTGAWKPT